MNRVRSIIACIAASAVLPVATCAAQESGLHGRTVLEQHCSRCHAVGREGKSPHPQAPAFRNLGNSYDMDTFADVLRNGVLSVHPDMPSITFPAEDADAAAAYLRSIQ